MSSKSVIVLGESGMLGGYVSAYLQEVGFSVVAPERFDAAGITSDELQQTLAAIGGEVVINCIGSIRQRTVDESEMRAVNAEFPHRLARACEVLSQRLIHVSTDCVFSGARGAYTEQDAPDARDVYGISKAAGEPAGASVIRTSLIGSERRNKRSLLEWVKSNAGKEVDGYVNHVWNGVTCLQLAKLLAQIIEEGSYWQGLQHYYSPHAVTKHELVSIISDVYRLDMQVRETNAPEARNMTLASEHPLPLPPEIRAQLVELYAFDKTHGLA